MNSGRHASIQLPRTVCSAIPAKRRSHSGAKISSSLPESNYKNCSTNSPNRSPYRFCCRKVLREGPQNHMDVQLATQGLVPGSYELLISQQDGKKYPVEFKILPNPPKIDNLPILLNQGTAVQHFVLKGERLDLITKLEALGADFKLNPPTLNQTERSLTVELRGSSQPGTVLAVKAYLKDRNDPLTLPKAVEITGPLPVVASAKLSLPTGIEIGLRSNEFPAG